MHIILLTYGCLHDSAVPYCLLRKGKLLPEISVCDAVSGNAYYTSLLYICSCTVVEVRIKCRYVKVDTIICHKLLILIM